MTKINDNPAKRVMITGANRGIGLELTRQSAAMGDEVIACCRTPMEAAELMALALENDLVSILGLDVRVERDMKLIAAGFAADLTCWFAMPECLMGAAVCRTPNKTAAILKTC